MRESFSPPATGASKKQEIPPAQDSGRLRASELFADVPPLTSEAGGSPLVVEEGVVKERLLGDVELDAALDRLEGSVTEQEGARVEALRRGETVRFLQDRTREALSVARSRMREADFAALERRTQTLLEGTPTQAKTVEATGRNGIFTATFEPYVSEEEAVTDPSYALRGPEKAFVKTANAMATFEPHPQGEGNVWVEVDQSFVPGARGLERKTKKTIIQPMDTLTMVLVHREANRPALKEAAGAVYGISPDHVPMPAAQETTYRNTHGPEEMVRTAVAARNILLAMGIHDTMPDTVVRPIHGEVVDEGIRGESMASQGARGCDDIALVKRAVPSRDKKNPARDLTDEEQEQLATAGPESPYAVSAMRLASTKFILMNADNKMADIKVDPVSKQLFEVDQDLSLPLSYQEMALTDDYGETTVIGRPMCEVVNQLQVIVEGHPDWRLDKETLAQLSSFSLACRTTEPDVLFGDTHTPELQVVTNNLVARFDRDQLIAADPSTLDAEAQKRRDSLAKVVVKERQYLLARVDFLVKNKRPADLFRSGLLQFHQ